VIAFNSTNPPSKLNLNDSPVAASSGKRLYITALLKGESLTIDNSSIGSVGPVSFCSPISCSSFNPTSIGQVAYYES